MSTSTIVGNSDGLVTGLCPAPPPPPPPPPVPGQMPAMRINTVEAATRRPQIASNDAYEPPAAIQNAMLTKDKKPFTYTPGMGGKLDLSQIRSPRMARRVAKNANDEGIEGPPKSALEPKPAPASVTGPNLFVQPQVAIPVFPTNVPVQPPVNRTPPTPTANKIPFNAVEKQPEPVRNLTKVETKVTPAPTPSAQPSSPESPKTPTQVTLAKAPTPWLQNKNKPPEELPEWAKRSGVSKQSSSSPESPTSPPIFTSVQQIQPPQWQPAQQKPAQQKPQQYQYQQPQQFSQQPQQFNQQQRVFSSPPTQASPQAQTQERVIPIRIEDRPSVFDVKREPGHHQFKQPSPHHQQRWGQGPAPNQVQSQPQPVTPPQPQPSTGGAFIIPIMVEGSEKKPAGGPVSNASYSQQTVRNNVPSAENQAVKVIQQRGPTPVQQLEPGPLQSRSFRVLQKITDTDTPNDVDTDQLRKLQLSDDDRILMNKFKEQVDNESSLHHEEDPRYRGAAIPSRAFRFLQTMTDGGEAPMTPASQRAQNAMNKKQNRNSKTFEESQANLPPSEQQVPEPKKYMGSAIPSRSFRILQAMTAPESVATQENRQADYTCQTENNVPGNQQGVFLPPCPPPFWSPDGGWWGYYPLPYPGVSNDSNPYHPDNTAYIYFPIYNQNYPGYPPYDPSSSGKNSFNGAYPSFVVPVPPQNNSNCSYNHEQDSTDSVVVSKPEATMNIPDVNDGSNVPMENGDLNSLPQWDRTNNVSRTASSDSKDSNCTTAMNITDEEEIPDEIAATGAKENVLEPNRLDSKACANVNLNVNVPNYTYIDTSDSSDSTDTESQSDNESVIESSKSCSDNNSEGSSSDSDDSDSYLAYSTGLNPHGKGEKDNERTMRNSSSKESCDDSDSYMAYSVGVNANERTEKENKESNEDREVTETSLEKNNIDEEADAEEQAVKEKKNTSTIPHKLSVIYEDIERPESESPRPQETRNVHEWKETPFEATDDPPDETDTTTVSVSLPLRFKFSVSENNEDVTTVIVGDSTIKPERSSNKDDSRCVKMEQRFEEKTEEVSANFVVKNDTSVDFTVKREGSDRRRTRNCMSEKMKEETVDKSEDPVIPHVNFTLRKVPTKINRVNCEETVETEFTIRRKTSAKKEEAKSDKEKEELIISTNASICNGNDTVESKDNSNKENEILSSTNIVKKIKESFEVRDINKNILKPEVIISECNCTDDTNSKESNTFQTTNGTKESIQETCPELSKKTVNEEGRSIDTEEQTGKETKHLLSVQNSREETDDEDSGVTSDMSRMISEVDTDSECTSSKNRKYQRTQTHSRLFKLLNDDSIVPEDTEKNQLPFRREHLSLPLKSNGFSYDENYCSNYSSGVTSPDYSPVCEQSWRRLHESETSPSQRVPDQNGDAFRQGHQLTRQDRGSCKEDPYYQAWKTSKSPAPNDHDVVPSLAFKVLENRRPLWAYKVNVLCPRIKSTKSVPLTLQASKTNDSPVPPNPSSYVDFKTDHC